MTVAEHWEDLVTTALLGTDRRAVPEPPDGGLADLVADLSATRPTADAAALLLSQVAATTAVRRAGAAALVRVPVGRFDTGSRALDFGADALIAPMINSADDARQFASFSKYPPMGERSWGPGRAMELAGAGDATAFLRSQNGATMALAMIETREALAALDDILAIEGIDGVFVGPSDLSIALNRGTAVEPLGSQAVEASAHIAKTARAAGKCAGIYSVSPAWVKTYADQGFALINIQQDSAYLAHGIRAVVDAARG